jgi:hypothetical protein
LIGNRVDAKVRLPEDEDHRAAAALAAELVCISPATAAATAAVTVRAVRAAGIAATVAAAAQAAGTGQSRTIV